MKFVIKLFPEITIKSKSVRKQITKILRSNLQVLFRKNGLSADVQNRWDSLVVVLNHDDEVSRRRAIQILTHTPGIGSALEVTEHEFSTLDEAYQQVRDAYAPLLENKRFCVRVKRSGQHDFTSHDAEIYMGGGLLKETGALSVSLKNPEIVVKAEIRNNKVQVVRQQISGIGGYPLGSQGEVLSLMSGGFDSTVASYLMMRRGLKTHFLFFNLGGSAHEVGVKQVAHFIWNNYSESHRVKFITVPFEQVVEEILKNIDVGQMGVVLKRMMMRAASHIADRMNMPAIVTGESIAQVASQTITNLAVIDKACEHMILRPLASMHKAEIIDIARRIGTETFAANMPEYCGVISVKPTTVGDRRKVEETEQNFNFDVLTDALNQAKYERIDELMTIQDSGLESVEIVNTPSIGDIIIDIRHPQETADAPLTLTNNQIMAIPFYDLESQKSSFKSDTDYLLYCQKGTMSKIHAHHLHTQGIRNIKVYIEAD